MAASEEVALRQDPLEVFVHLSRGFAKGELWSLQLMRSGAWKMFSRSGLA